MGAFKGKYSSIEDAHCLDVNRLVGQFKKAILKEYPHLDADGVRAEVGNNLKLLTLNEQKFEFTSVANKLGGIRWMVLCPNCSKRVIKLYMPESAEGEQELPYHCKDCHNLRSPSALYGPTRRYKELVRPMKRMETIKKDLHGKNLSEKKTKKLLDEYDALESKVKNSTFYRKMSLLASS